MENEEIKLQVKSDGDEERPPKANPKEIESFGKVLTEMMNIKKRKAGDYGNAWRILGIKGIFNQIESKFIRYYTNKDKEILNNEPLRDTLLDMANYCVMAIQLIDSGETDSQIDKLIKQ